ncbi:MAG TPA: hypothetical protein VFE95_03615 [Pseudomonas sp.]|nr:hypothetical protein [Pseudomonas sp.]
MEVSVMGRLLMWTVCFGGGFWLGSHRLVPLWAIGVLIFLSAGLLGVAEWLEQREGHDDDAG